MKNTPTTQARQREAVKLYKMMNNNPFWLPGMIRQGIVTKKEAGYLLGIK